jgi:hypothetical protein
LSPNSNAVVVGAGLNLTLNTEQLPIENATSLALLGDVGAASRLGQSIDAAELDDVLSRYL